MATNELIGNNNVVETSVSILVRSALPTLSAIPEHQAGDVIALARKRNSKRSQRSMVKRKRQFLEMAVYKQMNDLYQLELELQSLSKTVRTMVRMKNEYMANNMIKGQSKECV